MEISEPVRVTLGRLVKFAKIAVITGRSRQDAMEILAFEPHLLIGNHGAEWPGQEACPDSRQSSDCRIWNDILLGQLGNIPGVEIEFKGESLTLHYRASVKPERNRLVTQLPILSRRLIS